MSLGTGKLGLGGPLARFILIEKFGCVFGLGFSVVGLGLTGGPDVTRLGLTELFDVVGLGLIEGDFLWARTLAIGGAGDSVLITNFSAVTSS